MLFPMPPTGLCAKTEIDINSLDTFIELYWLRPKCRIPGIACNNNFKITAKRTKIYEGSLTVLKRMFHIVNQADASRIRCEILVQCACLFLALTICIFLLFTFFSY